MDTFQRLPAGEAHSQINARCPTFRRAPTLLPRMRAHFGWRESVGVEPTFPSSVEIRRVELRFRRCERRVLPVGRYPRTIGRICGSDVTRTRYLRLAKPVLSQLSYRPIFQLFGIALEGKYHLRDFQALVSLRLPQVGVEGFEPPIFCSQSRRLTRLGHTPKENVALRASQPPEKQVTQG